MPICITCSTPVKNLYTTYSRADDRSLGKGVRLTQCPNCKRFADKYVEHDYVVLFIDLVLIKPQVYRHLLFNRLYTPTNTLDPSILRLGILLILFDVYITWARIERSNHHHHAPSTSGLFQPPSTTTQGFSGAPIITQYLFFLTLNVGATVVQHGVVRGLVKVVDERVGRGRRSFSSGVDEVGGNTGGGSGSGSDGTSTSTGTGTGAVNVINTTTTTATTTPTPTPTTTTIINHPILHQPSNPQQLQQQQEKQQQRDRDPSPQPSPHLPVPHTRASPSAVSTALLVSSCTKLFPILLVIWPTSTSPSAPTSTDISPLSPASTLAPFAYRATSYIGWIVLLNNIEALLILLDCGYVVATMLAVAGLLSRWVVEGWLLSGVGLVRELEGPVGDVIALWEWFCSTIF